MNYLLDVSRTFLVEGNTELVVKKNGFAYKQVKFKVKFNSISLDVSHLNLNLCSNIF